MEGSVVMKYSVPSKMGGKGDQMPKEKTGDVSQCEQKWRMKSK